MKRTLKTKRLGLIYGQKVIDMKPHEKYPGKQYTQYELYLECLKKARELAGRYCGNNESFGVAVAKIANTLYANGMYRDFDF